MTQPNTSKNYDFSDFSSVQNEDLFPEVILLLQRWRFILFTVSAFAFIGGIYLFLSSPDVYEAKATLMVSSGQIDSIENLENDEILRNKNLVPTYAEIARNEKFISDTLEKLDMSGDPKSISKRLKLVPFDETELIHITFRDENPQIAAAFVNEVTNEFIDKIEMVMSFQNLKIIDLARIPGEPLPKRLLLRTALIAIAGLISAVLIILISEMLQGKIKDPRYFEEILDTQVLSNIPIIKK